MFSYFDEETPPFVEYKECFYKIKSQHSIVRDQVKYQPHQLIISEFFDPTHATNIETCFAMEDLGFIVAETLMKELRDPRKTTHNHLSSIGGRNS